MSAAHDISATLLGQVRDAAADARLREAILRCCSLPNADQFSTEIHRDDQMLTHSLREHRDAGAALSQYFNLALQQYDTASQVMQALFPSRTTHIDILDFACGFGRLLRFLTVAIPRERIWASELQVDALEFVARTFGIETLASHADPAQFNPAQRFDFIWVASLFTHLPENLFAAWLAKLYSLLKPGGALCFSVRDAALLDLSVSMPASGILYQVQSENSELDAEIYGTTYANETFVRRMMQATTGGACAYLRLPRALANEQDLYILAKDAAHDFSGLAAFRRGAWGWVDRRRLSSSQELYLEGWAGSQDEGAAQRVDIRVDGVLHSLPTSIARPDVVAAFADDRLAASGWAFRQHLQAPGQSVFVEVTSYATKGQPCLLYAGTLRASD